MQTCWLELLDRTLIWNERHLRYALYEFERHHNAHRPDQALNQAAPLCETPEPQPIQRSSRSTSSSGQSFCDGRRQPEGVRRQAKMNVVDVRRSGPTCFGASSAVKSATVKWKPRPASASFTTDAWQAPRALFRRLDHLKIEQRLRPGKIIFLSQKTTYRWSRCVTSLLRGLPQTRSRSSLSASGISSNVARSNCGRR